MKCLKRPIWTAFAVLLQAAVGVGPVLAQAQQPPAAVTVAKPVVKEVIEHDDYTGRFNAVDFVEVRARVTGYLTKINFTDGAFVKKGDVLFVIDQRPYKAALDQAKAAEASAKARVSFSQTDLERAQALTKTGNITEQSTDQRRQSALTSQADLDSAMAAVTQASLNLDFTEVRAPVAGKISQRLVSEGNIVVADQTQLTTIVSLDPIYFSFTVDERSFLEYQKDLGIGMGQTLGQNPPSVLISLTGEDTPTHKGILDFVDNNVDNATGSILLRATVENHDTAIKPGLFGVVSMPASKPYQGVLIPDEAVATNQDKRIVYVVGADNTITSREVRIGGKIDGYRIVRKGLDGSETIVISGLTRVRPGAKVAPDLKVLPQSRS
ncbi:efflux RND transporter periplasmic adaptor subunit [Lichenifustis flavocetrariae]|uniref:Efflux RND transporter periplasmic adaptor subunit n=1 Tax=Lichenifustis flavocetrariae TaxID=2949735 RepID=A0AA41YZ48_9HYPH|nr:efflux RND transporter periplasmic adaptor subunit [Lichenifustis flavocetrariae]MCW6510794.1 efflux RND transporter periplasmic adaptor subunit [Lichenifustis flavocetrariae]